MKPFHTIAIPHDDILGGRLTMDVFAADLWEVYKGRSAEEYQDPTQFFQKTYVTAGLTNLLDVVHKRLQGSGGDPVLQLQTPFGGGKTHALIALYHKAAEWDVRPVVFVGTPLAAGDAPWIMLEQQLTGERREITEWAAPGREALRDLLLAHQPVLILMDELPEYMTKAAAVRVGDSTLAAQTVAFVQELTEAVANLPRAALLITFPTGRLERQEERAEELQDAALLAGWMRHEKERRRKERQREPEQRSGERGLRHDGLVGYFFPFAGGSVEGDDDGASSGFG